MSRVQRSPVSSGPDAVLSCCVCKAAKTQSDEQCHLIIKIKMLALKVPIFNVLAFIIIQLLCMHPV